MSKSSQLVSAEDLALYEEVFGVAEYMYSKLPEIPLEEKWDTTAKLRRLANDLLFSTSQAVGNTSPTGSEYDWGAAHKHAFSLRAMYRLGGRQKFINLEPEMMLKLDRLIKQLDSRVDGAYKQTDTYNKNDLEHWRSKYKLAKGKEA
ncbi:MAG TPA: hypothetical protein VMY99_03585 [Nevskiaceae bacterium]|nr:hypothetical protein [Nevskiaceae bacterium]